MRICCNSICFAHENLLDMLASVKEAGYEWVELVAVSDWIHADLREIEPESLQEILSAAELKLAAICPGGVQTQDREAMRESVDYIFKAISLAEHLGCGTIVFTGEPRETGKLDLAIEGYKLLAERLAGGNVHICLENHYRNQVEYPEDYANILERVQSENFAITLDTGHFTSSGVDGSILIDQLPHRIAHMHIKDHLGTRSVRLGEGETLNELYLSKLAQIGYGGFLSVELELQGEIPDLEDVVAARQYLEALVRKVKGGAG